MNQIAVSGSKDGSVTVGRGCSIGAGAKIMFAGPGSVELGDYVTIGDDVKMIVEGGAVSIGEWSTLHAGTTVLCKNGVSIGAHCWFGQNSVIDGTGGLTIENGVRVGMYSQLWTHVAAGEQIEGCTLYGETPSHIEPDVWLVGTCTLGSGVRIGRRTVALAGSNITKSCPPNVVLAGAPARVKDGLSFYRDISLDEKFELLSGWISDAPFASGEGVSLDVDETKITLTIDDQGAVIFYKRSADFIAAASRQQDGVTLCCVESKRYVKMFSDAERRVLKYLSGNKARFYSI